MTNRTIIPIAEARKNIFKVVDAASRPGVHYLLTERGKPKAVIMGAEEYESWVETMEIQSLIPDLPQDIAISKRAVKSGAYKRFTTLSDSKKKYGLSHPFRAASRKRAG